MRPTSVPEEPVRLPHGERRKAPRAPFRKARRPDERVSLLGATVDLVRPEEVIFHISNVVAAGRKSIIANHNLHSIYLFHRLPAYRTFFARADVIEVDSRPMIFFARALGVHSRAFHRCTYLDWRELFWVVAARNRWRIFYLGGAPGVAEAAAQALMARYPGVEIASRNGYFDPQPGGGENEAVLQEIRTFDPDVLFVGMGMPRQELWIDQAFEHLPNCAVLSVGAAFDYEAGVQSAAPRWMGQIGLEWLHRLVHDPKRLFARYCLEPWTLIGFALLDVWSAIRRGFRPPKGPAPAPLKAAVSGVAASAAAQPDPARR